MFQNEISFWNMRGLCSFYSRDPKQDSLITILKNLSKNVVFLSFCVEVIERMLKWQNRLASLLLNKRAKLA